MSKILSQKICSLTLSCLFAVSAVSTNSFAGGSKTIVNTMSFSTKLKEGCKNLYRNHTDLYQIGIAWIAVYGIRKLGKLVYREWYLRDVVTKIDGYSKEQINSDLGKEIENYKNRAPDVFKVDDKLLKFDKRFLLLTFMKLNYLFDKYDLFTEQFINYKRSCKDNNSTFLIGPFTKKVPMSALTLTHSDLSGFALGNYSLKGILYRMKEDNNSGYASAGKTDELIEHLITHEFGHLIEILYITQKYGLSPNDIHLKGINRLVRTLKKEASQILDDIDNIIKSSVSNSTPVTLSISEYGDTDPEEFFAEVFAHLECSDPKDVNELGKALDKFITETMHYKN